LEDSYSFTILEGDCDNDMASLLQMYLQTQSLPHIAEDTISKVYMNDFNVSFKFYCTIFSKDFAIHYVGRKL